MNLTNINNDKMLHFFLTALLAVLCMIALLAFAGPVIHQYAKIISMVVCAVVALAKELWDARHPSHTSDGLDFVAGMTGAVCVLAVLP